MNVVGLKFEAMVVACSRAKAAATAFCPSEDWFEDEDEDEDG